MVTVIMTGTTGMIGKHILELCLNAPKITKVTSLVRRKSNTTHEKLKEVVVADFTDFSELKEHFKNQEVAFYCLGVYTGSVPRDEFRKITVDYTTVFADYLKENSPECTLCFLSGAGADSTEKSRIAFSLDKGIAENYLINKDFKRLHIFRPAYIYPVVPRKEPNISYAIYRFLYPILKLILPDAVIKSKELAHAMYIVGLNGGNHVIYENKEIKLSLNNK